MPDETVHLSVVEAYDRWSGFYDSYDNPMVFGAGRIIERLAANVAGKDIVEFGCGTGRNLARLKRGGAKRLIGCDLSFGMLRQARARDSKLLLFQQDMTQPSPLCAGVADMALFSLTLEHVAALQPPLAEAARLLRPGGRIVVIEIHPFLSLGNVRAHYRDGDLTVHMPTFPHTFADYINAAARAGLTMMECGEWFPRDFQGDIPEKAFKRGPDIPLLVEFSLVKAP